MDSPPILIMKFALLKRKFITLEKPNVKNNKLIVKKVYSGWGKSLFLICRFQATYLKTINYIKLGLWHKKCSQIFPSKCSNSARTKVISVIK